MCKFRRLVALSLVLTVVVRGVSYGQMHMKDPISVITDDGTFSSGFIFRITGGLSSDIRTSATYNNGVPIITFSFNPTPDSSAWIHGGNNLTSTGILGSLTNFPVEFIINSRGVMRLFEPSFGNTAVRIFSDTTLSSSTSEVQVVSGATGRAAIDFYLNTARAAFIDINSSNTRIAFGGAGTGSLLFANESGTTLARMGPSDGRLSINTTTTTEMLNIASTTQTKGLLSVTGGPTNPAVWAFGVRDVSAAANRFEISPQTVDGTFAVSNVGLSPVFRVETSTGDTTAIGDVNLATTVGGTAGAYDVNIGTGGGGANNAFLRVTSDSGSGAVPTIQWSRATTVWGRLTVDTVTNATQFEFRDNLHFRNITTSSNRVTITNTTMTSLLHTYTFGESTFPALLELGQGAAGGSESSTLLLVSGDTGSGAIPTVELRRATTVWGRLTVDTSSGSTQLAFRDNLQLYNIATSSTRVILTNTSMTSILRTYILGESLFDTQMILGQGTIGGTEKAILSLVQGDSGGESQVQFRIASSLAAATYFSGGTFNIGTYANSPINIFVAGTTQYTFLTNGRIIRASGEGVVSTPNSTIHAATSPITTACPTETQTHTFSTVLRHNGFYDTWLIATRFRNTSGGTRTIQIRLRTGGTSCADATLFSSSTANYAEQTAASGATIVITYPFFSGPFSGTTGPVIIRVCACTNNTSGSQTLDSVTLVPLQN